LRNSVKQLCTDIRRLTTGYVLRIASLGDFVVVRTCTYKKPR